MSDEERYQEEMYQRKEYEREEAQKAAMEQYAHDDYRLSLVAKIDDARLRELAEAEREGNIPRLKLGDKVYWLPNTLDFALGSIAEATISMVSKGVKTLGWKYRAFTFPKHDHRGSKDKYQQDFSEYDIGKEYFLTKAEAARALAEKGEADEK